MWVEPPDVNHVACRGIERVNVAMFLFSHTVHVHVMHGMEPRKLEHPIPVLAEITWFFLGLQAIIVTELSCACHGKERMQASLAMVSFPNYTLA